MKVLSCKNCFKYATRIKSEVRTRLEWMEIKKSNASNIYRGIYGREALGCWSKGHHLDHNLGSKLVTEAHSQLSAERSVNRTNNARTCACILPRFCSTSALLNRFDIYLFIENIFVVETVGLRWPSCPQEEKPHCCALYPVSPRKVVPVSE